jgi:hypothetical protein
MSIVQKCATAQAKGAVSDVTLDETSSSTMVQPHSVDVASSDEPCATADHTDTSEDVTGGADLCDVMHLSPKMHQALEFLFAGHSASATARLIGVHRNTIGRWRTSHAAFMAAYNRRRSEAADDLSRRITSLLETAVTTLEQHIKPTKKEATPEQIRASLRLISTLGRSRRIFSVGPTDPYVILDQMIRHDRYLAEDKVHTYIDDKTRASYINRYTMRLTDEAPDCDLPFSPKRRIRKGNPRELPTHPWDQKPRP